MVFRGKEQAKKDLILDQNKILHTCAKINKYYSIYIV